MSTSDNTATENRDVYTRVTSQIINAIEQGAGKFEMPWHCKDAAFSPVSINGLRPYRGVNTVALWATSKERGYSSGLWGTYRNWQEIGGQVRKGEKSALVVYWGTIGGSEDEENESGAHLFCKGYSVFNLAQVDGVKLPEQKLKPINERIATADDFFHALPGRVNHGYNQAFYKPSSDEICMPDFDQFKQAHGYYSTLAHEYTHYAEVRIMPRRSSFPSEKPSKPARNIGIIRAIPERREVHRLADTDRQARLPDSSSPWHVPSVEYRRGCTSVLFPPIHVPATARSRSGQPLLKKLHRCAVAQHVRRDALALERRTLFRRRHHMLPNDEPHRIAAKPASAIADEERIGIVDASRREPSPKRLYAVLP
jgi:antirestriction protein ArdC